jgi:hypothetical protein
MLDDRLAASAGADLARVLQAVGDLQSQVKRLQQEVAALKAPSPAPRLVVDVLFPPFKTTILDPAYPEGLTVTGQWAD